MREAPLVGIGDAVRAITALGLDGADARRAAALLLGLTEAELAPAIGPQPQDAPAPAISLPRAPRDEPQQEASTTGLTGLRELRRSKRGRRARWSGAEHLPLRADSASPPAPLPLIPPLRARAFFGALAAVERPGPMIDTWRAVERLARLEPLDQLPRHPAPTLRLGVDVLIDRGEGNQPFFADQLDVVRAFKRVAGERLRVLHFIGCPSRDVNVARRAPKKYQARRDATIVIVSDLGIGGRLDGASDREWLDFFSDVRGRVRVLVPYPAARWPRLLRRAAALVAWDRSSLVAVARRAARRGARG